MSNASTEPNLSGRYMEQSKQTQLDKFKQAARELETDDDEARFDERVRKLVKVKPVEKPRA